MGVHADFVSSRAWPSRHLRRAAWRPIRPARALGGILHGVRGAQDWLLTFARGLRAVLLHVLGKQADVSDLIAVVRLGDRPRVHGPVVVDILVRLFGRLI